MHQAAQNTSSTRMQALAAGSTALNLMNNAKALTEAVQALAGGDVSSAISLSLTVGGSSSKSEMQQHSNTARGSSLAAAGDINLVATGAGEDSNLLVQGSQINAGNNVQLTADNQVNLLAAQNAASQESDDKSASGGIGVGISIGNGNFQGGITVSANAARGNADGEDRYYSNTQINAGNQLNLQSGGDTHLIGAIASAEQVVANVGGDLTIQSLQDTSSYDSENQSLGGSITFGASGFSANYAQSEVNANYASVNQQSGIQAGDGGFQVNVQGDTQLIGGVIASTDEAVDNHRNHFETASLQLQDIDNHLSIEAEALSVGTSGAGYASERENDSSTTHAGISGLAGNSEVRTGDDYTGLQNTFDADRLQDEMDAQVAITAAFGQQASTAVGNYASSKVREAQQKEQEARQARLNGDLETANRLDQEAQAIHDAWGDSGSLRLTAHMLIGGLTGNLEGALGAGSGTLSAPMFASLLDDAGIDGPLADILIGLGSTTTGFLVGDTAGGTAAYNEVQNNYLTHHRLAQINDCLNGKTCVTEEQREQAIVDAERLSQILDDELQNVCSNDPSSMSCRGLINAALQYVANQDAWDMMSLDVLRSATNVFDYLYNSEGAEDRLGSTLGSIDQRYHFFSASDMYERNEGVGAQWFGGAAFVSNAPLTGLGADGSGSAYTFAAGSMVFWDAYEWRAEAGQALMNAGFNNFSDLYNRNVSDPVAWDINQLRSEQAALQPVHEHYLSGGSLFVGMTQWITDTSENSFNVIQSLRRFGVTEQQGMPGGINLLDYRSRTEYGCRLLGYGAEKGCAP